MAISVGAAFCVVLVGGQVVVPALATSVLRHRLTRDGRVLSAHVSALPWVQLLWHHADSVTARLASYDVAPSRLEHLLHQAAGIGTLEVSIGVVKTGLLSLHDVSITKHGQEMVGDARLELKDLQAALPIIRSLTPTQDSAGQLVLRGSASVLGLNATVDAVVAARDGKLVVAPAGLLGAFATLTLYDDPQIRVQSVTATQVPGGLHFVVRGRVS